MASKKHLLPIRLNLFISIVVSSVLIFLNFYGLFSNQFHFNKIESFIFPILAIIHFVYLYILWFKISENEYPDVIMKNIEYVMYGVLGVYLYKIIETGILLSSYNQFENHLIPSTFLPMGILIISFQILLPICAIWSFILRKKIVGKYNFDYLNNHIDSWG